MELSLCTGSWPSVVQADHREREFLCNRQHVELITASRPLEVYSPAIPGDASRKLEPLSIHEFVINRFKMIETDAYRPTSPGHSPGVGHLAPPGIP
ncbi:hypothetical protein PVL29_002635 [Vitis rotundifolia]|uniref:Uncharacterized protein n=1 Tax=Vitis rotundifolia TaxID=103349 RepID=A0AA39E5Y6_VITRO|nr:hypothetical protein PVL29_002635 [Vitis rotundifolia]